MWTHNCESVLKIAERGLTRLEDPCLLTPFPRFTLQAGPFKWHMFWEHVICHPPPRWGWQVEVTSKQEARWVAQRSRDVEMCWEPVHTNRAGRYPTPLSAQTVVLLVAGATPRPPPQMPTLVYTHTLGTAQMGNMWESAPSGLFFFPLSWEPDHQIRQHPLLLLCPICQRDKVHAETRIWSNFCRRRENKTTLHS